MGTRHPGRTQSLSVRHLWDRHVVVEVLGGCLVAFVIRGVDQEVDHVHEVLLVLDLLHGLAGIVSGDGLLLVDVVPGGVVAPWVGAEGVAGEGLDGGHQRVISGWGQQATEQDLRHPLQDVGPLPPDEIGALGPDCLASSDRRFQLHVSQGLGDLHCGEGRLGPGSPGGLGVLDDVVGHLLYV